MLDKTLLTRIVCTAVGEETHATSDCFGFVYVCTRSEGVMRTRLENVGCIDFLDRYSIGYADLCLEGVAYLCLEGGVPAIDRVLYPL